MSGVRLISRQFTAQVPDRPDLPDGCSLKQAVAVGSNTTKLVHWFLFQTEQEVMYVCTVLQTGCEESLCSNACSVEECTQNL